MSSEIQKKPAFARKHLAFLVTALGTLALFLWITSLPFTTQPADTKVHRLQTAQVIVTPNCNTYCICVTGTQLDKPNPFVKYSFTLRGCGPTVTISGSVPVSPKNEAGDFRELEVLSLGRNYCGEGTTSGSATLFAENGASRFNTLSISFSTSTNCPPWPTSTPAPTVP
jgi:hypothetical protein